MERTGLGLARAAKCSGCKFLRTAPIEAQGRCAAGPREEDGEPSIIITGEFIEGPTSNCPKGFWVGLKPTNTTDRKPRKRKSSEEHLRDFYRREHLFWQLLTEEQKKQYVLGALGEGQLTRRMSRGIIKQDNLDITDEEIEKAREKVLSGCMYRRFTGERCEDNPEHELVVCMEEDGKQSDVCSDLCNAENCVKFTLRKPKRDLPTRREGTIDQVFKRQIRDAVRDRIEAARHGGRINRSFDREVEEEKDVLKKANLPVSLLGKYPSDKSDEAPQQQQTTMLACIHRGANTEVKEKTCCGGKVRKIQMFTCHKHGRELDAARCTMCVHYTPVTGEESGE